MTSARNLQKKCQATLTYGGGRIHENETKPTTTTEDRPYVLVRRMIDSCRMGWLCLMFDLFMFDTGASEATSDKVIIPLASLPEDPQKQERLYMLIDVRSILGVTEKSKSRRAM